MLSVIPILKLHYNLYVSNWENTNSVIKQISLIASTSVFRLSHLLNSAKLSKYKEYMRVLKGGMLTFEKHVGVVTQIWPLGVLPEVMLLFQKYSTTVF